MAAITPATIFPNMTLDGTDIVIPLADIPGLTSVEANPSTGNGTEFLRCLSERIFAKLNALEAAAQPTQMRWAKPAPSGQGVNTFRQDYTLGFNVVTDPTAINVAPEP